MEMVRTEENVNVNLKGKEEGAKTLLEVEGCM